MYSKSIVIIVFKGQTQTHLFPPFFHTCLLQGDDHGAGPKGVPCGAVVRRVEVRLHDVVDGERGENSPALGRRFTLLHGVPLHQGAFLLLPHILLPCPDLKHISEGLFSF